MRAKQLVSLVVSLSLTVVTVVACLDGEFDEDLVGLFFYEWPELTKLRAQIIPRAYSRLRRE
jgi:hypothetical protein